MSACITLLDDSLYLLSIRQEASLAGLRNATWIAGCARCTSHLLSICADEGFEPKIGYTTDDMVVMQSLVAAGLGVTTSPGLALIAHGTTGVVATELPRSPQHIYAATYGASPDPPATAAVLAALAKAVASTGGAAPRPTRNCDRRLAPPDVRAAAVHRRRRRTGGGRLGGADRPSVARRKWAKAVRSWSSGRR
jgi:hypothetical protein